MLDENEDSTITTLNVQAADEPAEHLKNSAETVTEEASFKFMSQRINRVVKVSVTAKKPK